MRRGLMAWDSDEIPVCVLKDRATRLQGAMATANQDAMILYTNFIRSAAVSHLVGFSPYWADGILLVPRQGEPVFATTLSKRVGSWIQSVKPVGDLVNTSVPGKVIGERLAKADARRVAILELDAFPAGLYSELAAALPDVELIDGSETFATARVPADGVERHLLERAAIIAQDALGVLPPDVLDVGNAVGAVEMHARLEGAEEIYVAIASDLDSDRRFLRLSGERALGRRFAIRATVAYKGSWIRCTRTYSRERADQHVIKRADAWLQSLVDTFDVNRMTIGQVLLSNSPANSRVVDFMAESPVGTRPLAVIESDARRNEPFRPVPALVVSVALNIDGMPWCGARLAGNAA